MTRKGPVWTAPPEVRALLPEISGNSINGLGETVVRRPYPFFWHPPDQHPFGPMQDYVRKVIYTSHDSGPIAEAFGMIRPGEYVERGPPIIDMAPLQETAPPEAWSEAVIGFALDNGADVAGVAEIDPVWIFEGYSVAERMVIILGVAHDYEEFSQAPSFPGNNRSAVEVARQYARVASAANKLTNFIRLKGHAATSHEGTSGKALSLIPAAIASGLGELGKHGSMINRDLGASFRLSAVTTDLPLAASKPDSFGAEDFCTNCQICMDACPPAAISDHKQMVRGEEKYYVDFDACIPYFAETRGCGICIAVCPWSRPGVRESLLAKMARRKASRP